MYSIHIGCATNASCLLSLHLYWVLMYHSNFETNHDLLLRLSTQGFDHSSDNGLPFRVLSWRVEKLLRQAGGGVTPSV